MSVRICKKFEWMRPYIEDAEKMYPSKIKKLKKIFAITPSVTKKHRVDAQAHKWNNGSFEIGLYPKYQKMVFKESHIEVSLGKYSALDLLATLAHELAHCVVWNEDHTVKHKRIELKLFNKFLTRLKSDGYISEEAESRKPFYRSTSVSKKRTL